VLAKYLKDLVRDPLGGAERVRAYRGGYLPTQRRDIEKSLRAGEVTGVVATNALELGIDIGRLDACVLCGYPGTIASTWQQAGRAGRRRGTSLTLLVASSSALDQYIIAHPEYFFKQSPENALANPDNLYILMNHLKCAAFELPFLDGETFGGGDATAAMLGFLEEQNFLRHTGGRWHWATEEFPAAEVSLRSAGDENFMIVDITDPAHHQIIGEMDRYTVPMLLHEQAIYLHEARQYQVEKLDFEHKKAYIRAVDVNYYTDADLNINLRVLLEEKQDEKALPPRALGEVLVTSMVTLFKKMRYETHENLGFGPVDLPEMELTTAACWWTLPDSIAEGMGMDDLQGGMMGIAAVLRSIAPLYLMCAPRDLSVLYHVRDTYTRRPTIYLYDNCPGGVGLSEKVYDMLPMLLDHAKDVVRYCPCEGGCPSCVGPQAEVGERGKQAALVLLSRLTP
jgi:DEAD/DEAH box helicase domain-containing protein